MADARPERTPISCPPRSRRLRVRHPVLPNPACATPPARSVRVARGSISLVGGLRKTLGVAIVIGGLRRRDLHHDGDSWQEEFHRLALFPTPVVIWAVCPRDPKVASGTGHATTSRPPRAVNCSAGIHARANRLDPELSARRPDVAVSGALASAADSWNAADRCVCCVRASCWLHS